MWFKRKNLKLYEVTYHFLATNFTTLIATSSEVDALRRFEKRYDISHEVIVIKEMTTNDPKNTPGN